MQRIPVRPVLTSLAALAAALVVAGAPNLFG